MKPPVAKIQPHERVQHGDQVQDPYYWFLDKQDKDVRAYLEAENAFTTQATAGQAALREQIFQEIKRRTKETDLSVPSRKGGWWHYARTEEGKQYSIHCRLAAEGPNPPELPEDGSPLPGEQILLDGNALAEGHDFFSLGAYDISPDDRLLAYSTDFDGDERYTLRIRDLETGQDLSDEIPDTHYSTAWSADNSVLFYTTNDEAWRPYRVFRHVVGTPADQDVLVYEEPDERFWLSVDLTRSERYLEISLGSKITSESRLLAADRPYEQFRVVRARETGVEYTVDHWAHPEDPSRDLLLVVHNAGGKENFELATAPLSAPQEWTPLIAHDPAVRILDAEAFAGHFVLEYRKDGLTGISVHPITEGVPSAAGTPIVFDEPIYTVGTGGNPEYSTDRVRLGYGSLVTPSSVYDYDIASGGLTLLKRQPVLGGFDPADYEQRRVWATAEDGTRIPISVVHRRGLQPDGTAPCLLYGYGSYEASMDPYFSVARLSLLERGFVFAIAHIRGGGEMGRYWYELGKLLHKKNTFTDFVACGRAMVEQGWSAPDRLIARGGSAGGLLMGAIANLAPELWAGVLAEVPFVDALNTILDPSLPLTVMEWDEWGNPLESAEVYQYMKEYSPYENVAAVKYPPILARTSVNDTRVGYHEPAKWIARLRATAVNGASSDILLKTELDAAGHGGKSGRYDAWREEAFALAWVCAVAGVSGVGAGAGAGAEGGAPSAAVAAQPESA